MSALARCILTLGAALTPAAFLGGCFVIPTPEHGLLNGRNKFTQEQVDQIVDSGITTREDVLLRLGEPDLRFRDDEVFAYTWEVIAGYWAVGAGYQGAGGPVSKPYSVMIEFDDRGILKHAEVQTGGWFEDNVHDAKQWIEIRNPAEPAQQD